MAKGFLFFLILHWAPSCTQTQPHTQTVTLIPLYSWDAGTIFHGVSLNNKGCVLTSATLRKTSQGLTRPVTAQLPARSSTVYSACRKLLRRPTSVRLPVLSRDLITDHIAVTSPVLSAQRRAYSYSRRSVPPPHLLLLELPDPAKNVVAHMLRHQLCSGGITFSVKGKVHGDDRASCVCISVEALMVNLMHFSSIMGQFSNINCSGCYQQKTSASIHSSIRPGYQNSDFHGTD